MENKEAQKQIIELLVKNELIMADLYRKYSATFKLYEKFWAGITRDEENHAAWINVLYGKLEAGLVDFAENRFPVAEIEKTINYIQGEIERADRGEVTLLESLETAKRIEHEMLEGKFFEIFKNDSPELQTILGALQKGTEQHYREVERIWEMEGGGAEAEAQHA